MGSNLKNLIRILNKLQVGIYGSENRKAQDYLGILMLKKK